MVNTFKAVSELSLNESYLKEVAVFIANKQQKYYSENNVFNLSLPDVVNQIWNNT